MISLVDYYVIATKERPTRFVKTKNELVNFFLDARRFSDEEYAKHHLNISGYNPDEFEILPAHAYIDV